MVEISTSILSIKKEESIQKFYDLETAGTNYFHIDVMDGKFVKNNTTEIMMEYATNIKHISNLPLDVHLMVEDVRKYIEEYIPLQPNIITFHYEACKSKDEVYNLINLLKENNIKVGITIKPNTNIKEIFEFMPYVHMVLVMTVEPGLGGQSLIPSTIKKIKEIKQYCNENNLDIDIEADGGINEENIDELISAGIDIAVVGNAITSKQDYKTAVSNLKK